MDIFYYLFFGLIVPPIALFISAIAQPKENTKRAKKLYHLIIVWFALLGVVAVIGVGVCTTM